jgi:hypothetical protein
MPTIAAKHNQTLLDVAMQYLGGASEAVPLALANGISITDVLMPAQALVLTKVANKPVATAFANAQLVPASGYIPPTTQEGIGYMQVGLTFNIL